MLHYDANGSLYSGALLPLQVARHRHRHRHRHYFLLHHHHFLLTGLLNPLSLYSTLLSPLVFFLWVFIAPESPSTGFLI